MFIRSFYILLLLCVSASYVFAQNTKFEDLKFENYSPRNGLPSDFIETITQDKYGFIWLGTHNGLVRFDGVQFKAYVHHPEDNSSLPDNDARSILGDKTGKVWITSRKGLFYYKYDRDDFIKIAALANGEPINFASCPVLDKQGSLWFYSNPGICRMDCRTFAISVMEIPGVKNFAFSAHRLFATGRGNVWFCSDKDLYLFDSLQNRFIKHGILNDDGLVFKEGIQDMYEDGDGSIWIASLYGLYLLDPIKNWIKKYPYQEKNITDSNINISSFSYSRALTGDSILWCSTTYRGLLLFNLHTRKFIKNLLQDNYDASSIGGSLCYYCFADRNGILWVSHINGLSKLDWRNQQIKSYRIRDMVDSNRMMPIRKILPDPLHPAFYWLITWGDGVFFYDKGTGKALRHYLRTGSSRRLDMYGCYDGVYDNKGILWIGTDAGLCYYDQQLDKFILVQRSPSGPKSDTPILRMAMDQYNTLWLGTEKGLWKFDIAKKKFERAYGAHATDSGLLISSVYALRLDHHGKLYVGTRHGLYLLDPPSGSITPMLRPEENSRTDFNINYVWGLDVDRDNNLWVATRGAGLYKYNSSTGTYTDYKISGDLTTEELRDIFVDSVQNIWISSYDGIFKMDGRTKKFTRYAPGDGLDNFNISLGRWSVFNNKIYSGSPGAYSIINPYAHTLLTDHFPVWITGIKILDRSIHFNPDSSEKMEVPVDYRENIINFEFAAICYTASSKIQYAYLLEGFDKDWHFAGNQRFANYNNLSGGRYTFRVKAMNAGGLWSETAAAIAIYVKPAFWKTWWFRLAVILAFTGGIYWAVKKRIATIRKEGVIRQEQAEFRQKLAETEMVALRTQMNPHFIFNCMNIIDGLITGNRKKEAQDFLQKFSRLIRMILENSQYPLIFLRQDLEALDLYMELEAIRYNRSFTYRTEADPRLLEENYRIPPLLIQPYVENAIVHGLRHKGPGEGKLLILVTRETDHVQIVIEDNGIGRTKANALNQENGRPHQPIGMNITGKRIDLLRMTYLYKVGIDIADLCPGEETGTRVKIELPLNFEFE